jgi:acyl-CoA thioester hydrolase
MTHKTFRHTHRVTYAECTVGNHVYYARYLDFIEAARGEFFRSLGEPLEKLQQTGVIFPVFECRLGYRAAARYDDVLHVDVWVREISRVRLVFACRITRASDGELVLDAETTHACTNLADKMTRIPRELAAKLQAFCEAAGAGK